MNALPLSDVRRRLRDALADEKASSADRGPVHRQMGRPFPQLLLVKCERPPLRRSGRMG